jgi:hypothetical protein
MRRFANAREAKEFLVSKVVQEALRENVPLSEVERKMLYFTETAWTLPDMAEVSAEFDSQYDQREYERKVTRLIRNARKRARKEDKREFEAWPDAIRALSRGDHYILVMARAAGAARPPGDLLKLWGTGFALVVAFVFVCIFVCIFLPAGSPAWLSYLDAKLPSDPIERRGVTTWLLVVCAVCVYLALLLVSWSFRRHLWAAKLMARLTGKIVP